MRSELKSAIWEWEKLRVAYNLIVGVFGLWLSWDLREPMGGWLPYSVGILLYGATANIAFSLGPLAELYIRILTPRSTDKWRLPVFATGTLFSTAVTAIAYWMTEFSLLTSDSIFGID